MMTGNGDGGLVMVMVVIIKDHHHLHLELDPAGFNIYPYIHISIHRLTHRINRNKTNKMKLKYNIQHTIYMIQDKNKTRKREK